MSEIKVVYWTGTGNTETMANAIVKGIVGAGGQGKAIEVSSVTADEVAADTVFALGCPAMGDEVLEEEVFEPFMEALDAKLAGKKVALFGAYGWGDGEWMRSWESRVKDNGGVLIDDGLMVNEEPDDEGIQKCEELGAALVKAN